MSFPIPQTTVRIWRNPQGDTYAYNGKGESELVHREPRKRGATITDRDKFQASWDEAERRERAQDELARAFLSGKTIQQLRRGDERRARRYRIAGIALLMVSAFLMIWLTRAVMG